MSAKYPAKILLFGEHTVLKDAQALALPINSFFGAWQYTTNLVEKERLQQNLLSLKRYLEEQGLANVLDIPAFATELEKGLYFSSNIPLGYGLGSSGALCAAIFDRFGKNQTIFSLLKVKQHLGQMESFFHGKSSGIDPLVSYLKHPILIDKSIKKVNLTEENLEGKGAIFLLDTSTKRVATPLINGFLKRYEEDWFMEKCETQLIPLVESAIPYFVNGQWDLLFETLHELSLFQFRYFDFMILEAFKDIWLEGLNSTHFKLKICGAGGGGFLLGISKDFARTQKELTDYAIQPIYHF